MSSPGQGGTVQLHACSARLVLSQAAVLDTALCWKSPVLFPLEAGGRVRLAVLQLVVNA